MKIKLISLNLGGYTDWQPERIDAICSYLNEEMANVVLLQEVRFEEDYCAFNQADELNSQLATPYPYTSHAITKYYRPSTGSPYKEGLSILSVLPILNSEAQALTQAIDDKHPRIIQTISVPTENGSIQIANVHLSNNQHSVAQLEELLGIYNHRNQKPIIVGDFNILNLKEHKSLYDKEYHSSVDVFSYASFPSKDVTIDYALIPTHFTLDDLRTKTGLSDHAALSLSISL